MAEREAEIPGYKSDYRDEASRWIVEVVIIAVVGSIINWLLVFNTAQPSLFLAFLVNLGLVVAGSFLLFRHVDTLIFKRLSLVQNGDFPSSQRGHNSETGEGFNNIVAQRQDTDLLTRVLKDGPSAIGYVVLGVIGAIVGLILGIILFYSNPAGVIVVMMIGAVIGGYSWHHLKQDILSIKILNYSEKSK